MSQCEANWRDEDAPAVRRAQGGDRKAFDDLVHKHEDRVRAHCVRLMGSKQDAEDAFQDTWVRAWRGINTFRFQSPFVRWLMRVAHTTCLNNLRGPRGVIVPIDGHEDVPGRERPDEDVLRQVYWEQVRRRICQRGRTARPRWDARDVTIFRLRCLEELGPQEIALRLGLREDRIKDRIRRHIDPVLKAVWKELSDEEHGPL